MQLARLEKKLDKNDNLVGLTKQENVRNLETWEPGVPLSLEESAGFLKCTLDLEGRLSRQVVDGKLIIQTTLNRGTQGCMEASEWYHEYIRSKNSFKSFGIEPRQLRFKNISNKFSNEMFVDRIRRHGFVFSTDREMDTPESLLAHTYRDFSPPIGFNKDITSEHPRWLAVIVGIEPTTTLLTIWKFKPEHLFLYYDTDSALSKLFCTRILLSLESEKWCKSAYPVPVDFNSNENVNVPTATFSWNITPGDKSFKTFLFLAWRTKQNLIMQQLLRTGELASIDGKPLPESGSKVGPPIQVLFKVHAYGEAVAISRDWNTEEHKNAREEMLQIMTRYRTLPPGDITFLTDRSNVRTSDNPSLRKIINAEWANLRNIHHNFPQYPNDDHRGFIWEIIAGILFAPLVDELITNSRVRGDMQRLQGRDSEEMDLLFRKNDKYGLISCKYYGMALNRSKILFFCREAKNNAERYLGSNSFSAVFYPDILGFPENLLTVSKFVSIDGIPGVHRNEAENLFIIDAVAFRWENNTNGSESLLEKLIGVYMTKAN